MRIGTGFSSRALAVAFVLLGLFACSDGDKDLEPQAKQLAVRFHNAVADTNTAELVQIVGYPFLMDDVEVANQEAFEKEFLARKTKMKRAVVSATEIETCTYGDFVKGKPVNGKSVTGAEAEKQAKKIGFREGGVLVRCYHKEDGKEDGRRYLIVAHRDALGDLKITSFVN